MALLIGMDEAGLGPNLGPFVVAATVWRVPGPPAEFDFWTAFDTVLTNAPGKDDPRLFVADSKQVFQPHRGLDSLERGIWSALRLTDVPAQSFRCLCESLSRPLVDPSTTWDSSSSRSDAVKRGPSLFDATELSAAKSPTETEPLGEDLVPQPWYDSDFALPIAPFDISLSDAWRSCCERNGAQLVAIRADVVEPLRFNRLTRRYDNKSQATSRLAMNLLRNLWNPAAEDALIVADKHGGRNRYDALLSETFRLPVESVAEGALQSTYRVGNGELRFQPRAESHGPVALASMAAKYLREVAMEQFNQFWQRLIPGLKPTQGYPLDARRFRESIAEEQLRLQISADALWRER